MKGIIDNVVVTNSITGMELFGGFTNGGSVEIFVSNSVVSANSANGFFVNTSSTTKLILSIDNSRIVGNGTGIALEGGIALLGRSVVTANGTGIQNLSAANTFFTYKDNRINENSVTDITSPLNGTFPLQ